MDWLFSPFVSGPRERTQGERHRDSLFYSVGFSAHVKAGHHPGATASGRPFIASNLGQLLHTFGPPACYLDFEAMMPPIPLYEGTRPYQTIPFQWSLHTIDGDGVLNHKEFLADGGNDPRRQFAETLIDALGSSDDPIIVYSKYEQTRLKELAAYFPDLGTALNFLVSRLADLLPIVRSAIYFPTFGFSNSIKSVAPALCPCFSYDDLIGVADGAAASAAFLQLASGAIYRTSIGPVYRQTAWPLALDGEP